MQQKTNSRASPDSVECGSLRAALDAVCAELGLSEEGTPQRAVVKERMLIAYRSGLRQPLNLVNAGLDG